MLFLEQSLEKLLEEFSKENSCSLEEIKREFPKKSLNDSNYIQYT